MHRGSSFPGLELVKSGFEMVNNGLRMVASGLELVTSSLDMPKLLTAFQDFTGKHFEHWADGLAYAETGFQLLLQAFLQRIINGGGQVEKEYGLGRQRTDLLIIWPYSKGRQQAVIELKMLYDSL